MTTKIANKSVITDFMSNFRSILEFITQLILTTMKKIFLAAALMALFSVNANAQFGFGAPQQQGVERLDKRHRDGQTYGRNHAIYRKLSH